MAGEGIPVGVACRVLAVSMSGFLLWASMSLRGRPVTVVG
jgi:hypothetical protein